VNARSRGDESQIRRKLIADDWCADLVDAIQIGGDALVERVDVGAVPSLEGLDGAVLMQRRLKVGGGLRDWS
jgi:hypothetical protein